MLDVKHYLLGASLAEADVAQGSSRVDVMKGCTVNCFVDGAETLRICCSAVSPWGSQSASARDKLDPDRFLDYTLAKEKYLFIFTMATSSVSSFGKWCEIKR